MDWTSERRSDAIVGRPSGRVDEASWQAFGDRLSEAVAAAAAGSLGRVIVDLGSLDYMSSRGLRALTIAKREADAAGITVLLARPNEVMREILAISRYDKLFAIADRVPAAD